MIDNFFATDIANDLYENINSLKLKDANSKFIVEKDLHQYNKFAFSEIYTLESLKCDKCAF